MASDSDKIALLVWEADERIHKPKRPEWFWALGIIAAALIVLAVVIGNILFAVIIALSAFLAVFYARKAPDSVYVEIRENGVRVNTMLYQYRDIRSFWIRENGPNGPMLFLLTGRFLMPMLHIPVGEGIDIVRLRNILLHQVEEHEYEESLLHTISDRLGF